MSNKLQRHCKLQKGIKRRLKRQRYKELKKVRMHKQNDTPVSNAKATVLKKKLKPVTNLKKVKATITA